MSEFLITLPVYIVLYVDQELNRYLPFGGRDLDIGGTPAIFTEELFAERARDVHQPNGVIWKIETPAQFDEHLHLFLQWKITHAAIDPFSEEPGRNPGPVNLIPIRDLRIQDR